MNASDHAAARSGGDFSNRNIVRASHAITALATTLCVNVALAQGAGAPSSTASADETELEEVIITGIRASLERSIEIKRNADTIVDSIASEDLGKFPDANVAESLQRITGVSISRNNQGEGSGVTVRGFGPSFNTTMVNGRTMPGTNGFSFDGIASELISGADVYKSSSAKLQDGGIGALINLRMARPFDVQGSRVIASVKVEYEELSGETAPSAFALFSSTFGDDRWGVLGSVSYQRRDSRTDSGGVLSYLPHQNLSYTSGGVATPVATDVFFPRQNTTQVQTSELSRLGITGALQFKPSDNLLFTLDGLWNKYKPNTRTNQLSHYFTPDNITSATIGANNTVTSLTTNENGHTDFTVSIDHTPRMLQSLGLNVDWHSAGGLLDLNLDVANSASHSNSLGIGVGYSVIGYQNVVNWAYSGSGMPSLSTSGIPSLGIPANTFTDPSLGRAHYMTYGAGTDAKDSIDQARLDGTLNLGDGLVPKLHFGAYFSSRENRSDAYNVNVCSYCGYFQPVPASLLWVFDAGGDFLGGGNFPTSWLTFDPDAYVAYLRSVSGNQNLYRPSFGVGSTRVKEKVSAAYVQADFAGAIASLPWTANVGVRYTRTKIDSQGYSIQLIDLLDVPGDPTFYNGVYASGGASIPVSAQHSYGNVLPTLNFKLNVTDALIARFAASKSLTRPALADLAPRLTYTTLRSNNLVASSGNADLKPYVSTNLDASLEWYYNRGGFVTLALFRKKVDDYIVQSFANEQFSIGNSSGDFPTGTATFRVRRPRNVETAEVKGLELAFQHTFDYLPAPFNGLGFSANATFVDSPSTLSPGDPDTTRSFALEGVGDSQNMMVFYEMGPFGVRASYNHRDDYLENDFNGEANEPLYVKGSGQLDAQASYRLGEHLSFTLEGSNLTDTAKETYGRYENQFIGRVETGPRYAIGVRATF